MKFECFTLNKIGERRNLEDFIYPAKYTAELRPVFIVCDGVGGINHGEIAAEIAAKSMYKVITEGYLTLHEDFQSLLENGLEYYKTQLQKFCIANSKVANMSTTLALVAVKNNTAYLAWCGDSRIYVVRSGKIIYKSNDHSLVNEMVQQGIITETEAISHPQRNIITRSLNIDTKSESIAYTIIPNIKNQDWILLCSDGLLEQFTETNIKKTFVHFSKGIDYSKEVEKFCNQKTKDNYSMYLINIEKKREGLKRVLLLLFITAFLYTVFYSSYSKKKIPYPNKSSIHKKQ